MARLPETGRIRSVQVHLVGSGAELDENAAAAEIYPSGRRAFGEGTGNRISICSVDGLPTSLVLERPAYSNDQIYVAENDGTVLITDFFGAALEWLPSGRRSVGDDQLVDLLLYRTVPGAGTLLEHVSRVGQGDRLEWRRGASWVRQVQQLDRPPEAPIPEWQVIGRLHDALAAATRESRPGVDANLFSGGVDSTLLQHYLGADVQAVTVTIDSPEFAPERTYAAAARGLLAADGLELAYREDEYRPRLHETIRVLRLPPHHLQTVSIDAGYASPHECYFTAQFADALFGLGFAGHAQRAWRMRGAAPLGAVTRRVPGPAGRKARTLQATVQSLRVPAGRLNSYAQRFAVYTELPVLAEMVGAEAVAARLQARLDHVLERLASSAPEESGLDANLELGHWLDYLCDDTVTLWGQLALGRGKKLVAPFTHPEVVRASRAIPVSTRYARRGTAKYWLKRLLQRELPSYPIRQPKYSSGLPFARYYRSGPLAHALRDYDRPSFVPPALWQMLDERPGWLTWTVLTYLIWDAEVRADVQGTARSTMQRHYPA